MKSLGLSLGESKKFLKEIANLTISSAPTSEAGEVILSSIGSIMDPSFMQTTHAAAASCFPGLRSFASSNFKRIYDQTECPKYQDQVRQMPSSKLVFVVFISQTFSQIFGALRHLLSAYCTACNATQTAALATFERLQKEAFIHADELIGEIEVAATRLWTSALSLEIHPGQPGVEFCSLLNDVLRRYEPVSFVLRFVMCSAFS